MSASSTSQPQGAGSHSSLALALGAIGVVFGDIGTSPLYALSEAMNTRGLPAAPESVLGVVSLIIWTLMLIVSIKYMLFVTAADNDGEGGIFAIVALLRKRSGTGRRYRLVLTAMALASVGLLFADSLITPALSIMAALEGLDAIIPNARQWVVPGAILILIALFFVQRYGTALLGKLFGPVMLVWFTTIAALGLAQIVQTPGILAALNPLYGLRLIGILSVPQILSLMGSVLLAVTGAEAIYADMGHFGRRPIKLAWYVAALHALLMSYLGQGAWLLRSQQFGASEVTPFFSIVPEGWVLPMVVLAAAASVIASQAVISGLFSLARQAIQLGYLPRLRVVQTSQTERGQIYVPRLNTVLGAGCIAMVLAFGSSSALASSYGFAVAGTMLLTTLTFTLFIASVWRWTAWKVVAFGLFALPLDVLFLMATVGKLESSHYFTAGIAAAVVWLLVSWLTGNRRLMDRAERLDMPVGLFAEMVRERSDLHRLPRAAVYFQHLPFPPEQEIVPSVLMREVQLTSGLASPTVVVTLCTTASPFVPFEEALHVQDHEPDIHSVILKSGFAERCSVEPLIAHGIKAGWWRSPSDIAWFAGREQLRSGLTHSMPFWIRWPFMWLHRQDLPLSDALRLPAEHFVEVSIVMDV